LCEETSKKSVPSKKHGNPADDAGIEYLDLYWIWALDTHSQTWRSANPRTSLPITKADKLAFKIVSPFTASNAANTCACGEYDV
jgi:hypothetical protein